MNKKRWFLLGLLLVLISIWCVAFPSGDFGYARYAFTIFNRWPRPVADFEVRCDGASRRVAKTHDLDFDAVQWLTNEASVWRGVTPQQMSESLINDDQLAAVLGGSEPALAEIRHQGRFPMFVRRCQELGLPPPPPGGLPISRMNLSSRGDNDPFPSIQHRTHSAL